MYNMPILRQPWNYNFRGANTNNLQRTSDSSPSPFWMENKLSYSDLFSSVVLLIVLIYKPFCRSDDIPSSV